MSLVSSKRGKALVLAATALCVATPASADSDFVETSGRVLMFALPAAGAGYAWYKGDRQGVLQIGASVATAVGTAFLLKQVVKEERPDHSGWDSFPSDSTAGGAWLCSNALVQKPHDLSVFYRVAAKRFSQHST